MEIGRLALRGIVGPLFIGHGTQKLFGWFGGHGPDATGGAFESMGLRPGKRHATAAGVCETAGGALLALGALTPLASAMVSGVMMTAIRKAHLKNGPWATEGGFEYPLVVIGSALALAEAGPGRPSVDAELFPGLNGTKLAVAALAAAGVGSYLATSERFNETAPTPEATAPLAPHVEEPARKFAREPSPVPADQTI